MRLRLPTALLLAGAAVVAAPSALAQNKPPTADADKPPKPAADLEDSAKEEARKEAQRLLDKAAEARTAELIKRGKEACESGDPEEGIAALSAVFSQKNSVDLAVALGACEAKAGKWPSAAEHLAFALRVKEDGPDRKKIEEMFVDVRKRVGGVKVVVDVEGADVIVGERLVGQSPLPGEVYVEPGRTTLIVAKKPGHEEAQREVTVAAKGTAEVSLKLPFAQSTGNRYAAASRSKVPMIVLGGLALVAGGVGASLYTAAKAKESAADDILAELEKSSSQTYACSPSQAGCATVKDLRTSRDTMMNVGTGVLIGSGVLLGAAALAGAWAFSGSSSSTGLATPRSRVAMSFAPVVTADGGGVWIKGAF
jgi:hypothetical protein